MSETQVLLSKIAALRQRLEQAQKLVSDAGSTAAALLDRDAPTTDAVAVLERKGAAGARQNAMLDSVLRQLPGNDGASESAMLPAQLTTRAARLLKRSRELLAQLRGLGDDPLLQHDEGDPLAVLHRETAAMLDTILRTVQAFPEAASAQIRLCEGLDVVLNVVADRLAVLGSALAGRRRDRERIDTLAELLTALASGQATEIAPFTALAEALIEDAQQGLPLRYLHAPAEQPARFVAAHCLMTAQVIVRLTRHDPDWRGKPLEPVLAALVHDVGMLRVPAEVLTHPGPLDDAGRRAIETHVAIGADMVAKLSPYPGPLIEATAGHHERLEGTGYPAGLRELQIKPLVRLLAVCDMYAAMCSPRPHRPACEPRTALTDTLLAAEKGALDRHQAERLLQLSFYPAGCVVELADGAIGVVIATHQGRRDLTTPARPVVALLTDAQGQPLPLPVHLDLAECEGRSILRSLQPGERRDLLGKRYPEWV